MGARDEKGRAVWVTRVRPKIDRIACPWLIRRFVDPGAIFLFVAASEMCAVGECFRAIPFDIEDVFWSHRGDGMIWCYVVRDEVAGFGEHLVDALDPAPAGRASSEAPQLGPRLQFPPDRVDCQRLKNKLERDWIPEMCGMLGLGASDLPVLRDADFLLGPKDDDGADSYVLCEINVSSVYPFPSSALGPLVRETLMRIGAR